MRGEFVDVGGARLYYYAAGTRGAGEPLVLIHGFPTSGHLWSEVVPLLPPGHRTVVLDLLGYGRSDRPGGAGLAVQAHADRVLALMDALHIGEAALVGHGVGGGVAQSLSCTRAPLPGSTGATCCCATSPPCGPARRRRWPRASAPCAAPPRSSGAAAIPSFRRPWASACATRFPAPRSTSCQARGTTCPKTPRPR
ncbi:MAG: hypothetical protein B7Z72_06375 [Gemmatimonadetes bacterium 21-71-4]|nr:MAG: hypothetical protein B7Z72_06375 [Gemmatimonadetes bacterium 21-71-4]